MNDNTILKVKNLCKVYTKGNKKVNALNNVNVRFSSGKLYAIMGRSGSGKSTLINILGLLDNPTSGEYFLGNIDTTKLTDSERSKIISKNIGFVFQSFYLNNNITALENVILPTLINNNIPREERKKKATKVLSDLGLKSRINHSPKEMSGGEQQRVAIARALINDPNIIIADEPTGNLDKKTEKEVFNILKEISKNGKIVIVVSHNEEIKKYADKLYEMDDGVLEEIKL